MRPFDMEFPFVLRIVSFDLGDARFVLDVLVKFIVIRISSEMGLQVGRRWTDGRGLEIISLKDLLTVFNGQIPLLRCGKSLMENWKTRVSFFTSVD